MFDHVELPVSDLHASQEFYRCVLEPLGISQTAFGSYVEFGALTLTASPVQDQRHFAFVAESRDQVDAFHRAGSEAGYQDNGAPGLRSYAADYYGAYLLDPDGHNVEAVHRAETTRAGWSWLGRGLVST